MKCKVRLSYSVEMFVEGESEDTIQDWLNSTTPMEAKSLVNGCIDEDYHEEILCHIRDDSIVDYVIE